MKFSQLIIYRQRRKMGADPFLPWWMGIAWFNPLTREYVCCPIGLNVIVSKGRDLWLWAKYLMPGKMAQLVESEKYWKARAIQLEEGKFRSSGSLPLITPEPQRVLRPLAILPPVDPFAKRDQRCVPAIYPTACFENLKSQLMKLDRCA